MSDIFQEASMLLDVAEKCTGHSGKLSSLQSAAINRLIEINNGIKAEAVRQAKAVEPPAEQPVEETIFTADDPNPKLTNRRV